MRNSEDDEVLLKSLKESWAKIDTQLFIESSSIIQSHIDELLRFGRREHLKTFPEVANTFKMAWDYSNEVVSLVKATEKFFNEHPEELAKFERDLVSSEEPKQTPIEAPIQSPIQTSPLDAKAKKIAGFIAKKKGQPITPGLIDWVKKQIELGKFQEE
jgi:hypothetical protein